MDRREALKATVGTLVTAVVGSNAVQASQNEYNLEWREEPLPFLDADYQKFGWYLYINGHQVGFLSKDIFNVVSSSKYDMATIAKMKYAAEQEIFWQLEKQNWPILPGDSHPDWFLFLANTKIIPSR